MKKHSARLSCTFFGCTIAFLLAMPGILVWSWQTRTKCLIPTLPITPPQMKQVVSGYSKEVPGLLGEIVYWTRESSTPSWWKLETELPYPAGDNTGVVWEIAAQNQNIWLMYSNLIYRYDANSREHFTYLTTDDHKTIDWVEHILVTTKDETVWSVVKIGDHFALVYFDEKKEVFKIAKDRDSLFSNWKVEKGVDAGSNLGETADGKILISFQKNILIYAPDTKIARLALPENFGLSVNSIAVSGNDLWFTDAETRKLWKLNLTTNALSNYGTMPRGYDGPVAIDGLGRIWLGYFARLEPIGNEKYQWWYPEAYPTEFIGFTNTTLDTLSPADYRFYWPEVNSIYVASNNSIWFTSTGVISYDINQDSWCLSAPDEPRTITKDEDGNLWMVPYTGRQFSRLYKYETQP